jgi:hypothetical protein
MIDDNVEKKVNVEKKKGHAKTDTEKAKAPLRK